MDGIGSTEMLHMFIGSPADEAKPGSTGTVVPGYQGEGRGRRRQRSAARHGGPPRRDRPDRLPVSRRRDNQRKYVQHGWNLTGDAYRQDEDGYFWYEARTDDMIISSGYNVSGVEVENVLLAHASVAECAVVGVPDEARGQIVKAFVVPAAGVGGSDALARELQDFVKAELAPYKYPRAIEFVAELPRTLTGKLQRYRLRAGASRRRDTSIRVRTRDVRTHEPAGWPRPKGYANAVSATGRMVFVSGQVGWDPVTHGVRRRRLRGRGAAGAHECRRRARGRRRAAGSDHAADVVHHRPRRVSATRAPRSAARIAT